MLSPIITLHKDKDTDPDVYVNVLNLTMFYVIDTDYDNHKARLYIGKQYINYTKRANADIALKQILETIALCQVRS